MEKATSILTTTDPAVLRAPLVERGAAEPVFAAAIGHRGSGLGLLENTQNLMVAGS